MEYLIPGCMIAIVVIGGFVLTRTMFTKKLLIGDA